MLQGAFGPYVVETELGSGGTGTVYRATGPPGVVALKVIHPHLTTDARVVERFLAEAEIGMSVRHPNVVATLDAGTVAIGGGSAHYVALELIEGRTLRAVLDDLAVVPEDLCAHVAREVALGLAALHAAGVVHRDLKPENLLLGADHTVKVMDLGFAHHDVAAAPRTPSGAFIGSLQYAAPEQFRRDAELDGRADLHALGVVLYELACGEHPFTDPDWRRVIERVLHEQPPRLGTVNPQVSPFFEEVVRTLIEKDADRRLDSAAKLAAVLSEGESSAWWRRRVRAIRSATRRPLRRARIKRETRFVGRSAEIAELETLLREAKSGSGRVVLMEGEAGIGKSRLVDEFVTGVQRRGDDVDVLLGTYPLFGAATARGAFSTAFREHLGTEGLVEVLEDLLGDSGRLAPGLEAVLTGGPAPASKAALTPGAVRTCFVRMTQALAAERPVVVVIEDLHLAPEVARSLFSAVAGGVGERAVLLIGTARPGLPSCWTAPLLERPCARHVVLPRLADDDIHQLLTARLRSEYLVAELAGPIVRRCGGNPWFVSEMVQSLRESGVLTRRADCSWELSRPLDEAAFPTSVVQLVETRLAGLSDQEREILDAASCCGLDFDPRMIAAALEMDSVAVATCLARIERRHRLVHAVGRRFVFDHHPARETLYGAIAQPLRSAYHAALGAALEARPEAAAGEDAVRLCEHFLSAGHSQRALPHLRAALDHLEQGHLHRAAIALARRVLGAASGQPTDARVRLLLRVAKWFELVGPPEDERAALDEALELSADGPDEQSAEVRARVGWFLCRTGRLQEAEDATRQSLEQSRRVGARRLEARTLGALGMILFRQGRYEEARTHHELGLVIARGEGDLDLEASTTGCLGNVLAAQGLQRAAREHYERWLALAREIGERRGEAMATGNLGSVLLARGRLAEARAHYERRLELAREDGDRRGEAVALDVLGLIAARLGDLPGGRALVERSRALGREIGAPRLESYALEEGARIAAMQGELDAAERGFRETVALRRGIDYRAGIASVLVESGSLAAFRGRIPAAIRDLEEARELADAVGVPQSAARAACALSLLPGGDADGAAALLAEHGTKIGHHDRIRCHFQLWQARGDAVDLDTAHRLLVEEVSHAPEVDRGTMIANVPLHRAVLAAAARHGSA